MDGAGKFVRGDAIAGIIITVINVLGGFAIGAIEKGWGIADTARVFTILTIGDGLASQLPSFVISLAAALIVTRAGAKGNLGTELTGQLASRPAALLITSGFIGMLAMTPLPTLPLATLAIIVGAVGYFSIRGDRAEKAMQAVAAEKQAKEEQAQAKAPEPEDLIKVDVLELEVGYGLVPLIDRNQGGDLLDRIIAVRRELAAEMGFVMPSVRIRDNMTLEPNVYIVKVRGSEVARAETRPGALLAMDSGVASGAIQGEETTEPAFGLPAWWIDPSLRQRAETMNYTVVDPASVVTTHIMEVVRAHAEEILTREEVGNLVEQLKQRAPRLVEEAIPAVISPGELQKVLQSLLRERVSIRDLEAIVETMADWAPRSKDPDVLVEYARNALRRSICAQYAHEADPFDGNGGGRPRIACVTLDPSIEDFVNGYVDRSGHGTVLSIPADAARLVATQVSDALNAVRAAGHPAVVVASPQVRGPMKQLLDPFVPDAVVLGYNEIVREVELETLGLVTAPQAQRSA